MIRITLATAVSLHAGIAFAQDAGGGGVPSWQGAYVGASVVHGEGTGTAIGDWADWIDYWSPGQSHVLSEPDGTTGAIRAGYDWQLGHAVVGLGAEYAFGRFEGIFVDQPDSSAKMEDTFTVFARAGVAVGKFLPYALVGYTTANGHYKGAFTNPKVIYEYSDRVEGHTLGLGAEFRFHDRWTAFGEFTRTDFGTLHTFNHNAELEFDQYKLGIAHRF